MTRAMQYHARRISAATIILFSSVPASAGGLLDQWTWARAPDPVAPKSRVQVSIGSFFGDSDPAVAPDLRPEHGADGTYWSTVVHQEASDLLDRPGGGFAYVSLPTDGVRNISAVQLGFFDIRGLGAGFDDSGSTTVNIAHEKVLPAVIGQCGRVLTPARTIIETEPRTVTEVSDDNQRLTGVEFNVVLDDKVTYAGVAGFQSFAGARFINYGDSYLSSFADTSGGTTTSNARALSVSNRLVGAHAGITGKRFLAPDLLLTGRVAAGLFANFATRGGSAASRDGAGGGYSFEDTSRDTGFAQVLEFSPALHYRIRDNMFVSLGGTFMLLNGVDRASGSAAAGFASSGGRDRESGAYFFYGGRATFHWTFN